ncbi:dynamin family protein [Chondromyces crocatus]|nr:dynamin family protein [Chondromyces crocatus]
MTPRSTESTLLEWYTRAARPFLEHHAPGHLASLDQQSKRLAQLTHASREEVAACFLGAAGVGKSTLLNALVSERYNLLPHGGVGPLTAQATVVRYADAPYFRATYLPASALNRILFAIERAHEIATRRALDPAATEAVAAALDEEERREAEAAVPVSSPDDPTEGARDKIDAYERQVRLLIQGEQQGEIDAPFLLDALRTVLGLPLRWNGRPLTPEERGRIEWLRECIKLPLRNGAHREQRADGDLETFLRDLREHASGFLAPLIKRLEVGWTADALREGLTFVDLPGVGVANDEYRNVTAEWIRDRARAIVLVVDRAGVTEASADLLRSTGFLNRLLHDSDDAEAEPVSLAVVMVKVDQSADAAWQDEKLLKPGSARKWGEHWRDVHARAVDVARAQLRQELEKLSSEGPDATRDERQAALARVLDTVQIHAVSAPQYRLWHLQDDEERPRIKSAEESRVPELLFALRTFATDHRARRDAQLAAARADFQRRVRASLDLVRAEWELDARAEREAQQLREELETFLAPKQRELDARQGAFREFLRESLPAQIDAQVNAASLQAKEDIARYLGRLKKLHWATLRATVRRGGAHLNNKGVHLDLPNALALRFEEPIAIVWSKHVLTALRRRTAELGQDYVALVGEVVTWARSQDARVQGRFVEALHESLVAQTQDLASIGKDAVDELKKNVRAQLYAQLVTRVRQRCQVFVDQKSDVGPGVKQRILELFGEELAAGVVEIARPAAAKVLRDNYNAIQAEITERFAAYQNPLDSARDAIVGSHQDSIRRSDAERRQGVLDQIDTIARAAPETTVAPSATD